MEERELGGQRADQAYVKKVADATALLKKKGFVLYGTQDWHPRNHVSFASNHPGDKPFQAIQVNGKTQVLWPDHCVQGTDGAKVLLDNNIFQALVKKGQDQRFDSYSGFQDDGGSKTEMDTILKAAGIKKLVYPRPLPAGGGGAVERRRDRPPHRGRLEPDSSLTSRKTKVFSTSPSTTTCSPWMAASTPRTRFTARSSR